MAILIGVFAGQKTEYKEAQGYSTSTLPTTIDLNDTSTANIRSYYSSLNNLSTSERQGTNLLKNLKTILKNGQKYYSYDSGSAIWQIYEISDRDWTKSPASSTTYGTYSSNTNKITNYTYGTGSGSSAKNNPYIHALYINRNVTNQTTAWDNHNQDQWGINREHVWPKAEGFENSGAGGARGDPMHLMAGNGYANNIHSNYYYGYVKTSSSYTDCGTKYSNQSGNLRGTSKTLNTGTVFEPQDCDKGDIARAIFYMVARYNYLSGSDSDGIDSNNPNLALTQSMSDWASSGYSSTTSKQGKMGILTDLLAWHHADPVDQYEIHRNNLLYTNYTNNRNPFIDFPEWVDYIWGTATYSGTTYQSYNSTPTGYAKPSTDTINGYNSSSTPTVNSVAVSPDTVNLDLNGTNTCQLTATVSVSNGAAKTVSWTSSNTSVATVSNNGLVTGVATGEATITVRSTVDNSKYATCSVSVIDTARAWEDTLVDATMTPVTNSNAATINGHDGVKVGTSGNPGSMTITVGAGAKILRFYAAAWKNYPCTLSLTGGSVAPSSVDLTSDTGVSNATETFTLAGDESDYLFNLNLSNINSETTFTLTPSGNNRFVLWGAQYSTEVPNLEITSIDATVSRTFHVGDTITAEDITIKDNNNNYVTDFEFLDYTFTYDDAPSGGSVEKEYFHIPYRNISTALEVSVSRAPHSTPSVTKTYLGKNFSSIGDSYGTGKSATLDGIAFAIDGYCFNNYALSLSQSKTSAPGSIKNTTAYSSGILDISITGASPNIQLSTNGTTWVDLSSATPLTVDYYYFKLFYKNTTQTSYVNISRIDVVIKSTETALNVANYIMFEDTEGQCISKFDTASDYFSDMPKAQRLLFMTSDNFVISTARERFEAWALNQGKTINYTGSDYVISSNSISPVLKESDQSTVIVVVSISAISLLAIGMFLLKYKKKED